MNAARAMLFYTLDVATDVATRRRNTRV